MLGRRLLVVAVAVPPLLALVYLGGWPLVALLVAAAIVGTLELQAIFDRAGLPAFWPAAFVAAPLLVLAPLWPGLGLGQLVVAGLVVGGLVWALLQPVEHRQAVLGWTVTVAAPLYLGLPLGLALALRLRDGGPGLALGPLALSRGVLWLLLALLVCWACDGAAYLVGRSLGQRPFFHRISPKKTLEGTTAGLVAAALVGLALGPAVALGWLGGAALGLATGVAAILGDLAESLLKRMGGVKDSGSLFPGHGGLLDRVDSLLFAFVVVYYGGELARLFGAG